MIKHIYDNPITDKEILEATREAFQEGTIGYGEYLHIIEELNDKPAFDGKLKSDELERLKDALFTEKQIREIENFVYENRNVLSGFQDLVGDDLVPTKQFLFNIKHIGKLLNDDPQKTLSKLGITLRSMTTARLVKALAQNFMTSKQVFENRNELRKNPLDSKPVEPDKGIELPKEPVIWAMNHHFKDDALASVRAAQRPVTLMFGSIPLYFNTTDGLLSFLIGAILINRKSEVSRKATIPKAVRALNLGSDLLWCAEGVHNKSANQLILELYNGMYKAANENGTKAVPIIHYIFDPTQKIVPHELNPIHTVVDDPIDLTKFSEKAGMEYLREVLAYWYQLMMSKYGETTKEQLDLYYKERAKAYGIKEKESPLSFQEIGDLYGRDYRSTVVGYDSTIEAAGDYRSKSYVRPEEAFMSVSEIKDLNQASHIAYASELVRTRKMEDFQRKY